MSFIVAGRRVSLQNGGYEAAVVGAGACRILVIESASRVRLRWSRYGQQGKRYRSSQVSEREMRCICWSAINMHLWPRNCKSTEAACRHAAGLMAR